MVVDYHGDRLPVGEVGDRDPRGTAVSTVRRFRSTPIESDSCGRSGK
jgi:hypothetical protein